MFRFEEPTYLYLLLLLPFLAAFYLYSNYRRRKAIRKFGDPVLMAQLMPDVSKYRPDVKFWLVFAAIGLFAVLLARPQFGSKLETVKRQGVEVMIALDISNSMLAQDVQPSRLEKAKRLVAQLVDKMENDKVGMIVFAGDAFTQLPITSDYISAKMFLESINPSLISKQGTAIGAAINLATRSFTPQEGVGRAVIVITDGENHEGGAVEAAKAAVEAVDTCLGRVVDKVLELDGTVFITADHGNAETMIDLTTGNPFTAHTTDPVPFVWVSNHTEGKSLKDGKLADIAPTMLTVMGLDVPAEMSGESLIK